jgi:hypothetical protein
MANAKLAAKEPAKDLKEGELPVEALQGATGGALNYTNLVMPNGSTSDDPDSEDLVMVTCPKCGKKIRPTLFPYHLCQHAQKTGKS